MLKMRLRVPAGGVYSSTPPDHLPGFKGSTSKGRGGQRRGREERGGYGKGKKGVGRERGRERKRGGIPVLLFPLFEPWSLHSSFRNRHNLL